MNTTKEIIIGVIVGLILGGVAGYTMGYENGAGNARQEVRANLQQSGVIPPAPTRITSVSGKIIAVSGNSLTLDVQPPYDPTAGKVASTAYTVEVSGATVLISRELNLQAVPKAGEQFNPFLEKNIKLADLKAGMNVSAEAGADITSTSFSAKRIVLIK
ncbi:MAG: hypothetical protein WC764_01925 [Candidatus Paceibacterota bacterium]|jgi:hypothetical protein